jgi:4-oxalomesaconate tautomerase
VLGAVSVATAVLVEGSVTAEVAARTVPGETLRIEHPTGFFDASVEVAGSVADLRVRRSGVVRTARKLFDGLAWPRQA